MDDLIEQQKALDQAINQILVEPEMVEPTANLSNKTNSKLLWLLIILLILSGVCLYLLLK